MTVIADAFIVKDDRWVRVIHDTANAGSRSGSLMDQVLGQIFHITFDGRDLPTTIGKGSHCFTMRALDKLYHPVVLRQGLTDLSHNTALRSAWSG